MRHLKTFLYLTLVFAVTFSLLMPVLNAQSTNATLTGSVVDQTGAIVPDANISLVNIGTNARRQTISNREGYFVLPQLEPGKYKLRAYREGFAVVEVPDIVLNTNDRRELQIKLKVGKTAETITVEAGALGVETAPGTATVVDRKFVENLPLNGRSFQTLIFSTAGVQLTAGEGQFSIDGQRDSANYFTIDGVSANVNTGGAAGQTAAFNVFGGTNNLISVDALQEFKIQTSAFAAQFGRSAGGQIQMTTRSGQNRFNGSLSEYFRNDILDANNWFNNWNKKPKAAMRMNDFGGVFSGPVVIPKIYDGHDRTFFFVTYEGLRMRTPNNTSGQGATFASATMRADAAPGMLPWIAPFPIPPASAPCVQVWVTTPAPAHYACEGTVLNAYGFPTSALKDSVTGASKQYYFMTWSEPNVLDTWSVKLDHKIGNRTNLFARYNDSSNQRSTRRTTNPANRTDAQMLMKTITAGMVQTLTQRMVNDLRVNWSRNTGQTAATIDSLWGAKMPDPITALFNSKFASPDTGTVSFNGLWGSYTIGRSTLDRNTQLNVVDNFTYAMGKHSFMTGVDYRQIFPVKAPQNYSMSMSPSANEDYYWGIYMFKTALSNYTNPNAKITGPTVVVNDRVKSQWKNISFYLQDNWKVARNLTLDLGVRWEFNPPPSGRDGDVLYTFKDPGSIDKVTVAGLRIAPPGTPIYKTKWNNIAPRLGIAYQFVSKEGFDTVLRLGAGTFYDLGIGPALNGAGGWPHTQQMNNQSKYVAAGAGPVVTAPVWNGTTYVLQTVNLNGLGTQFPLGDNNVLPPPRITSLDPPYTFYGLSPMYTFPSNYITPRAYKWNVTMDQGLGKSQRLTLSYVGTTAKRLIRQDFIGNTNNDFGGWIYYSRNADYSNYNALQTTFTRRLSRGLQLQSNFTWSKSMDTFSNDWSYGPDLTKHFNLRGEYGLSDFDIRYTWNLSASYDIPKMAAGWRPLRFLSSGWGVDLVTTRRSGYPLTPTVNMNWTDGWATITYRPDRVLDQPLWTTGDPSMFPKGIRLNPAAFSLKEGAVMSGAYTPGANLGNGDTKRNEIRLMGAWQADMALRRDFKLKENLILQFRGESFNIFNHANFGKPDSAMGTWWWYSPTYVTWTPNQNFGRYTSTLGSNYGKLTGLFQIGGPRSVQLSMKLKF